MLSSSSSYRGGTKLYGGKTIIDDMSYLETGDLYIAEGTELKANNYCGKGRH
ncbi:MAG: hypothetical protein AB8U25_03040 [Rickettsiales endosymbiont of Dermacentor nuttalli]